MNDLPKLESMRLSNIKVGGAQMRVEMEAEIVRDYVNDIVGEALSPSLIRRLYACGPPLVGELLREIAALDPDVAEFIADRLGAYTRIPQNIYRALGADDLMTVRLPSSSSVEI